MKWVLIFCCLAMPAWAEDDLSAFAFDQKPGAALPLEAPFTAEDGRKVTLREVAGTRPALIVPGYFHCPNLCGVVRDDLFHALAASGLRAGQDYELVAVSIDPAETAAVASRAKAADIARDPASGAASGWHFLTGPASSLGALQAAIGMRSRFDDKLGQFLHPAGIVFATPQGVVSGYLLGVGYAPGDLRAGLSRAASGEIGQAASPILLLCFHFDPTTGRYTLAITKLLRLGAALTVLTVGGMLYLAHRRERAV